MSILRPKRVAHAHCDLMCGVYDPAQARIEAESVRAIQQKYQDSDDEVFRQRCVIIKEQRAELVVAQVLEHEQAPTPFRMEAKPLPETFG